MKRIEILQTGVQPIVLFDDDKTPLTEYSKNVSGLLRNSNVSILETSVGNVILRPQHIYSIIIKEDSKENIESTVTIENVPNQIEEQEDVIIG